MTIAHAPASSTGVIQISGSTMVIQHLSITHAEASSFVRRTLEADGSEAALDLVRRAIPIGLVALSMGEAGIDTGSLTRTLDAFAANVDAKACAALANLDQTLTRLNQGEQQIATAANAVLESLPTKVEAALAGQAGSVRASVTEAVRHIQAAGTQELTTLLTQHSESVRNAVSLDREGPVQMLRQDLLTELTSTRRELSDQLISVRGLVEAGQAATTAGAKSSRAVGEANEAGVLELLSQIVTDAGDLFEATGGQPGVGTTRRTGDAVATLCPAIAGEGRPMRLVLEAKHRSRPMTVKALREEIATGQKVRDAVGGLVVVPTQVEVPGGGSFCRLETNAYVVAAEHPDAVRLLYLLLREQVALLRHRASGDAPVDLRTLESRIKLALEGLREFDEVGKLTEQTRKNMEKAQHIGAKARSKILDNLTQGLALLH